MTIGKIYDIIYTNTDGRENRRHIARGHGTCCVCRADGGIDYEINQITAFGNFFGCMGRLFYNGVYQSERAGKYGCINHIRHRSCFVSHVDRAVHKGSVHQRRKIGYGIAEIKTTGLMRKNRVSPFYFTVCLLTFGCRRGIMQVNWRNYHDTYRNSQY